MGLVDQEGGAFFGVCAAGCFGFSGDTGWATPYLYAFLIAAIYAISDEIHQLFVDGRHGTAVDVVIDSLGALTALLLIYRNNR